jgi:sigma-B regulation protein RsbU (phosphoserine phosphatase)
VTIAYATSLLYLTLGVIIILLGLIIIKENAKQRINRITGVMMFFAGMGSIFGAFGLLLQAAPEANAALEPFRKIFLVWEFFFPQMLLFSLVFPREVRWAKRKPFVVSLIFLPHVLHFLIVLVFSSPEQIRTIIDLEALSERLGILIQPVTILLNLLLSTMSLIYEFHTNLFSLVNLIYIIAAIGFMVWGYHGLQSSRLKRQVGLVLWGIRASVGLYAIAFLFPHLNILHTSTVVTHLLISVALLIGAGSIAWAIIRYQFLDIRFIIRRGLIFSFASAILIGIYLLIYSQGKRLVSHVLSVEIPILEIIFIIFALLFFQPILGGIERLIEKIFMRDRLDYRNVLQNLSRDILTTLDVTALQQKITSSLQESMSLERAELLIANNEGNYTLRRAEERVFFNQQEEWIRVLKEENEPIGFDELSVRTNDQMGLDQLKALNAFLLIPLVHRGNMAGVLLLSEKITKTGYTTEEMTILSVLSNQAAIALENARLHQEMLEKQRMEEELGFARDIQRNLLPRHCPSGERFELAGYNLPSKEVGGDYYDFIPLDEKKIGIAIGDIAGKGIPAALLMSNLQAALRISAIRAHNTHEVVRQVNIHISQTTSSEKFATFFYGVLNTQNLSFEYTNAGHNYPILCRNGEKQMMLKEGGVIIGVMEGALYDTKRIRLRKGDSLVLYTDGITEALNSHDEEFGEHRLLRATERAAHLSAQEILDFILEEVIDFTNGFLQSDDLTLVVLKAK